MTVVFNLSSSLISLIVVSSGSPAAAAPAGDPLIAASPGRPSESRSELAQRPGRPRRISPLGGQCISDRSAATGTGRARALFKLSGGLLPMSGIPGGFIIHELGTQCRMARAIQAAAAPLHSQQLPSSFCTCYCHPYANSSKRGGP
jgi:hypothetical protein